MDGTPMLPEIRLGTPIVEDFAYIARNMRADEVAQFLALTALPAYVPDVAARGFIATPGPAFVMIDRDGLPVLAGGFQPVRHGVYEGWLVGTADGWVKHWRAMTKVCRGLMEDLMNNGAHRIFTCALSSRTQAHVWYERSLKMTREGTMHGYFADGQDAILFALVKS